MIRKILITFICVLLLPLSVQASSEKEETGKITLFYENGMADFSFYRVADFSEKGKFVVEDSFKKYPVELDGLDTEDWSELAETLSGYVDRDKIPHVHQGKTNALGKYEWEQVEKGLYLVIGEITKDGKYIYIPMPFLVTLPGRDALKKWDLDIDAQVKYKQEERLEASKKVVKVWKDDGNKEKRPQEITVELLKNGKVYDSVKLSKKNNWKHTWEKLPLGYNWKVVEKDVFESYTVTTVQRGDKYVLTNTYKIDETITEKKAESEKEELPQAGQVWWPIPILVLGGSAAFGIGCMKSKKWDDFYGES